MAKRNLKDISINAQTIQGYGINVIPISNFYNLAEEGGTILTLDDFTARYVGRKAPGSVINERQYNNSREWGVNVNGENLSMERTSCVVLANDNGCVNPWSITTLMFVCHNWTTSSHNGFKRNNKIIVATCATNYTAEEREWYFKYFNPEEDMNTQLTDNQLIGGGVKRKSLTNSVNMKTLKKGGSHNGKDECRSEQSPLSAEQKQLFRRCQCYGKQKSDLFNKSIYRKCSTKSRWGSFDSSHSQWNKINKSACFLLGVRDNVLSEICPRLGLARMETNSLSFRFTNIIFRKEVVA